MRFALLLLVLFSVTTATVSAQERSGRLTGDQHRETLLAADFEAQIQAQYPLTLALLAAEFPDDHRALLQQLEAIGASADPMTSKQLRVFSELKALRQRYADKLLFAPSGLLSVMLAALADFYDKVLERGGTEVCGRFAEDGSGVLFERGLSTQFAAELDRQSAVYMAAVVQAIEVPEYHGVATGNDWSAVLGTMVGLGSPQSFVATISAGDPADPDLCPALSAMFRASAALGTPEGARTRADFAKNLTGY